MEGCRLSPSATSSWTKGEGEGETPAREGVPAALWSVPRGAPLSRPLASAVLSARELLLGLRTVPGELKTAGAAALASLCDLGLALHTGSTQLQQPGSSGSLRWDKIS